MSHLAVKRLLARSHTQETERGRELLSLSVVDAVTGQLCATTLTSRVGIERRLVNRELGSLKMRCFRQAYRTGATTRLPAASRHAFLSSFLAGVILLIQSFRCALVTPEWLPESGGPFGGKL